MADVGITTGMLTISSILVASLIIGAALGMAYIVSDQIESAAERTANQLKTGVTILTTGEVLSTSQTFMIYVKNTGITRISLFDVDIFFDKHIAFRDGSTSTNDYSWNVTWLGETGNNNAWDPSETIAINVYLPDGQTVETGVHEVLVTAAGNQDKYQFSV